MRAIHSMPFSLFSFPFVLMHLFPRLQVSTVCNIVALHCLSFSHLTLPLYILSMKLPLLITDPLSPSLKRQPNKIYRVESVANKYCRLKYSCSLCPLRVEEPQTKSIINTMKLVAKTIIGIMALSGFMLP